MTQATSITLLLLYALCQDIANSQYQLVREDPFAQLSATLKTRQSAACDGEVLEMACPPGTKISIQVFQYGRSAPSSLVCPATTQLPVLFHDDPPCSITQAIMMAEELCQGKQSCSIDTDVNTIAPGVKDPCPGVRKYAEVAYKCKPGGFRSRLVCGGEELELACSNQDHRLAILSAGFDSAASGHVYCPLVGLPTYSQDPSSQYQDKVRHDMDQCQSSPATRSVISVCHGQPSCLLKSDPGHLGVPACNNLHVYLKTTYACVDQTIFLPSYLETTTTQSTTTISEQIVQTQTGSKYLPEEVKHHGYHNKDEGERTYFTEKTLPRQNVLPEGSQEPPSSGSQGGSVIQHPADQHSAASSSFIKDNQEKIVICLTGGVSLVLAGVLVVTINRMVRSYRARALHNSSSIISSPHTDLESLDYDMSHNYTQQISGTYVAAVAPSPFKETRVYNSGGTVPVRQATSQPTTPFAATHTLGRHTRSGQGPGRSSGVVSPLLAGSGQSYSASTLGRQLPHHPHQHQVKPKGILKNSRTTEMLSSADSAVGSVGQPPSADAVKAAAAAAAGSFTPLSTPSSSQQTVVAADEKEEGGGLGAGTTSRLSSAPPIVTTNMLSSVTDLGGGGVIPPITVPGDAGGSLVVDDGDEQLFML